MNAPLSLAATDLMAAPTSQIQLTKFFNADNSPVGKAYDLVDGKPKKRANVSAFASHCKVETFDSVKALADMIAALQGNAHLCAGILSNGRRESRVTTKLKQKEKPRADRVTRTKDYFELPHGVGVGLFDHDIDQAPDRLKFDADKLLDTLRKVLGIDWLNTGFVWYPSSSSYIRVEATGFSTGLRGHHTLVVVEDASDYARFLEVAFKRLVIAGFGYVFLAANGRPIVRTVIDRTVANDPSRAIYAALPELAPGMVAESSMLHNEAPPLDSRAFPDLTSAEEREFADICDRLVAEAAPRTAEVERGYRAARMAAMLANGVSAEKAAAAYNSASVQRLQSPWEIVLATGDMVTVDDILDAPTKFHGFDCCDPIEPEYRAGCAKIYTDRGSVFVSSYAHGGAGGGRPTVFVLERSPETYFDALPALQAVPSQGAIVIATGDDMPPGDLTPSAVPATMPPVPAKPQRIQLLSADDLAKLPPMQWRLKGILPARGLAAIYGPSGSGKSFLVLDMLAAVATGRNWYGHRCKPAPVVYVSLEGEAGLKQRVEAYRKHHGASCQNMHFVTAPISLMTNGDVTELARLILAEGAAGAVVCIDTLNQATPGADENTSADMGKAIATCKLLQEKIGGLTLLVHHTGKTVTAGMRGHSSLFAALDAAIEVSRAGDVRTWSVAKSKDGADSFTHGFVLQVVPLGFDADGDPISSCVVDQTDIQPAISKLTPQQQTVYDALLPLYRDQSIPRAGGKGVALEAWRASVYACGTADSVDGKRKAFQRCRDALVKAGVVDVNDDIYWPTRPPVEDDLDVL